MVCKGICVKYKAKRPRNGHYAEGHKRCQICELFMIWNGDKDDPNSFWCPCCGYRLRTRPRNRKMKERLREKRKNNND